MPFKDPAAAKAYAQRRRADPAYKRRMRKWRRKYKRSEKGRATDQRYYARRFGAVTDQITLPDIEARLVIMRNPWCHICTDVIEAGESVHLDHKTPLSRGGTDTNDNVGPAHAACNLWKYNRTLFEVLFEGF